MGLEPGAAGSEYQDASAVDQYGALRGVRRPGAFACFACV